ncbi:D-alanine--D-alanine ligase family protein [Anaerobacterium chartisolvens]|nr:D-alanine--D-alanine ligase family protein [Anaerobacterium chartisolvens]
MKTRLGLIFGGRSAEHEISVISAMHVLHFIDKEKYSVTPIYISRQGVFYTGEQLLNTECYKSLEAIPGMCGEILVKPGGGSENAFILSEAAGKPLKIDVLLPVFHGPNGEDGTLQGLFEMLDVAYTSCPVLSSALCRDKVVFKFVMQAMGIPVLEFDWLYRWDWEGGRSGIVSQISGGLGFPVIIKPVSSGSSIGIRIAKCEKELEASVDTALKFSERVVIEKLMNNFREVNCAVLKQRDEVLVTECEEEIPHGEMLTFTDKYTDNLKRNFPCTIPQEARNTIWDMSKRIYRGIDCKGTVRMDYLYDEVSGEVYMNEINTIAGALSYDLWEGSGISFTEIINSMVDEALSRYEGKRQLSCINENHIDIVDCLNGVDLFDKG